MWLLIQVCEYWQTITFDHTLCLWIVWVYTDEFGLCAQTLKVALADTFDNVYQSHLFARITIPEDAFALH